MRLYQHVSRDGITVASEEGMIIKVGPTEGMRIELITENGLMHSKLGDHPELQPEIYAILSKALTKVTKLVASVRDAEQDYWGV